MTSESWLSHAEDRLRNESGTARLDAEILLAEVINKDRSWILAHPEYTLNSKVLTNLNALLKRRENHEPLAYILNRCEFYGREFYIDKNVLVPRPESETMIDIFKSLHVNERTVIADVGCGSGALGITAALEKNLRTLTLIDIDPHALKIAEKNIKRFHLQAELYRVDLLSAQQIQYDVLLCNLPYVPDHYQINNAAMNEPKIAIFGGEDGLDLYRKLFLQLSSGNYGAPHVLTESLPFQHSDLRNIASSYGYAESNEEDFIQLFTHATKKSAH